MSLERANLFKFFEQLGQLAFEDMVGAAPATVVGKHRDGLEVLALDREVLDEVLADVLHPFGLGVGQLTSLDYSVDGLIDTLLGGEERGGVQRGALDHRDDVD